MATIDKQHIRMNAVSALMRSPFAAILHTIGEVVVCAEALANFIETGARWEPPVALVLTPHADAPQAAETAADPVPQPETTAVPDGTPAAETTAV